MIAMKIYTLNLIVCIYGLGLFLWWWSKTRKATTVYMYVTALFAAEAIEKAIHLWTGHELVYHDNKERFVEIILSDSWWIYSSPSLIVYLFMIYAMTTRIIKTKRALKRAISKTPPKKSKAEKNVLVISNVKATRKFTRGTFANNGIDYYEAETLLEGFDYITGGKHLSIILIGLSVIEDAGFRAREVLEIIRRENPWCIVVALSRAPNSYELFEARRAYFDDYVYLPIKQETLLATYSRWLAKVRRWRKIKGTERRVREGRIFDRSNIKTREGDLP